MKMLLELPDSPPLLIGSVAVAALTCAGLLWLNQSSALATTGQRIFELDRERRALLERRAEALVAYAAATDPLRLEARARAMGFGPTHDVAVLPVEGLPADAELAVVAPDSPLALTGGAHVAAEAAAPSLSERLLSVGLNQASADSRGLPTGIGSAP
jgi:hypothetical protein